MDKFLHEKYPATIGEDECEVEQQLGLGVSTYLQAMYIISIIAFTIGWLWLARLLIVLLKKRYTVSSNRIVDSYHSIETGNITLLRYLYTCVLR
jgi:hypothetical protein